MIPLRHPVVFDTEVEGGQGCSGPLRRPWHAAPEIFRRKILQNDSLFVEERVTLRDLSHDHRRRMTDSDYLECWVEDQVD
jgi:hypothetical protein